MTDNQLAANLVQKIEASSSWGWYLDSAGVQHSVRCISFLEYMNDCLYDEKYGYYSSGSVRIGRDGDFYTSSAIGIVMAEVIASYTIDFGLESGRPLNLIEWGAGTGRLSAQIAAAGRRKSENWDKQFRSIIIENHPLHAKLARDAIAANDCDGGNKSILATSDEAWEAEWLREPCLLLANELLDAFPVHRIQIVDGKLLELGVAGTIEEGFYEVYMPLTDMRIVEWLKRDGIELREGQRTEIAAPAAEWLKHLAAAMTDCRVLLIDYGHEADEYTAEHRMNGTLMCYWKHMASDRPFDHVGDQDITAHVPFTFIRHAAEESGWQVISLTTQKQFLIDNGVLELLQNHHYSDPFSEAARMNRAVRQLLLSDQMSETFKVMILDKRTN